MVNAVWKKEEQLKTLKRELVEVDKRILTGIISGKEIENQSAEKEVTMNESIVVEDRSVIYGSRVKL